MDRVAARNGRPRTSWPTLWCCAVEFAVPWAFPSEACPQSPGVPCRQQSPGVPCQSPEPDPRAGRGEPLVSAVRDGPPFFPGTLREGLAKVFSRGRSTRVWLRWYVHSTKSSPATCGHNTSGSRGSDPLHSTRSTASRAALASRSSASASSAVAPAGRASSCASCVQTSTCLATG